MAGITSLIGGFAISIKSIKKQYKTLAEEIEEHDEKTAKGRKVYDTITRATREADKLIPTYLKIAGSKQD